MNKIFKPTEYPSFYEPYMNYVPDDGNLIQHLKDIQIETEKVFGNLSDEKLGYRYDKDKWTIKDILVHLADCERVFIYRAMRIARGDKTDLPGFDEKLFSLNANANSRQITDIIQELKFSRASSIVFIETLTAEELDRTGTANGYPLSARLLVNHIYGHHLHHLNIAKEKYL
jgi:uncharacterized damage-inducible protein DinB